MTQKDGVYCISSVYAQIDMCNVFLSVLYESSVKDTRAKLLKVQGTYIYSKGKVKLSLALSEHHAMKVYWRSGDIAPHILDFGTRWR